MIKSIETIYRGYRFRSRLEARWAVYFDEIGLKWDYEIEGFKLSNGQLYMPDFYIPEGGYIEIKAEGRVRKEEIEKCRLLSEGKESVALFEGSPDTKAYMNFVNGIEGSTISYTHCSVSKWGQTPFYAGINHMESHDNVDAETILAIQKARQYRFEKKDGG